MSVGKLMGQLPALAIENFKIFWYYARVELTPPKPSDLPEIRRGIGKLLSGVKTGSWKQLTVKQAALNTIVASECILWFYIGECLGKRHLVGYKLISK